MRLTYRHHTMPTAIFIIRQHSTMTHALSCIKNLCTNQAVPLSLQELFFFIFSAATFGLHFDTIYGTEVYLHRKIFCMSDKKRAERVKLMGQKCRHQNIIRQEL